MAAVNAPVTDALVAAIEPTPSDVVLDLAAGTGDVAEAVAARGARVIATDLSPVMVEAARRRGIAGAEHRVMDMQAIELADASVDAVVSRFGYMLVPDAGAGAPGDEAGAEAGWAARIRDLGAGAAKSMGHRLRAGADRARPAGAAEARRAGAVRARRAGADQGTGRERGFRRAGDPGGPGRVPLPQLGRVQPRHEQSRRGAEGHPRRARPRRAGRGRRRRPRTARSRSRLRTATCSPASRS